jgi:chemotaxis protein MotC
MASFFSRAALITVCLACAPLATAQGSGVTPTQLQRSLSNMQDKAIHGDAWADGKVRELLSQIGRHFETLDAAVWRNRSSAIAASLYLFSGGMSQPVRRVLARGFFRPGDRKLVEAALAFAEGRASAARQQLAEFDPLTTDPVLGGPLSLIRGSLEMESDFEAARKFFETARLLAPGSVFEEAALRRQAVVLADLKQLDAFLRTIEVHARRFPTSPYIQIFHKEVLLLLEKMADPKNIPELARIIDVMKGPLKAVSKETMLRLASEYMLNRQAAAVNLLVEASGALSDPRTQLEIRKMAELARLSDQMPGSPRKQATVTAADPAVRNLEALLVAIANYQIEASKPDALAGGHTPSASNWTEAPDHRRALVKTASERLDASDALLKEK